MKKTLLIAVLGLIALPSLVYGAWWNPWTWNTQPAAVVKVDEPVTVPVASEPVIVEKVIEKPVDRVVTKTITVQDPTLQKKIDALVAENKALKVNVSQLESDYGYCRDRLSAMPEPKQVSPSCQTMQKQIEAKQQEADIFVVAQQRRLDSILYGTLGEEVNKANINTETETKLKPITNEIKILRANYKAVCE